MKLLLQNRVSSLYMAVCYLFLSSIILTINFRSSHYPRQPRSRATVAVYLGDPSSLSQRRCASLHQTGGEVHTCEIVGAPCKDGQITSEFFRPLVSPGMEGMLIHIPKPGKCAIKNSIKSLLFIGPESHHWLCLSLTNSLTHCSCLVNFIDVTCGL